MSGTDRPSRGFETKVRCSVSVSVAERSISLVSGLWSLNSWPDLAATRSPTLRRAVPWALRSFTAGFGMEPGGTSAL
jgi:hypothetical protein